MPDASFLADDLRNQVLSMINGAWMCQVIAVACRLDLPDRLAAAPQSAYRLASELEVDPIALHRLLRALTALGLAEELTDGTFGGSSAGGVLRRETPGSLRGWALMSATRIWGLWSELGEGIRTGRSARHRRGVEDYGELDADPALADEFNRAMISFAQPIADALCAAVPFDADELIVDVGGGAGHVLATLLAANPHARGIVFDLSHAAGIAEETLAAAGLSERARFVGGSFFDGVPEGAHAYVLKSVLHNWTDERALAILRSCARAMRSDARVILVERVMPERLSTTTVDREAARADLQMLVGCDGCERTIEQYGALCAAAGLGLTRRVPLVNGFAALEARQAQKISASALRRGP